MPVLFEHKGTEPDFIVTEDHLRVVMHRGPARSAGES